MKRFLMLCAALLLVSIFYLFHFIRAPEPKLPGVLTSAEFRWDGYMRTYTYYTPSRVSDNPALVFVFHGSGGDTQQSRELFGYAFETLAEEHGFLVMYPAGYKNHYNGCRKQAPYQANTLNIDDIGFMRALVDKFMATQNVNSAAVYATGFSNSGQMALRLALEAPELITAVALVSTSIPADDNMDCVASGEPAAVLLMNGTGDPMNPYAGGKVALYGLVGDRGDVISSKTSVLYWANLAGHTSALKK